MDISSVRFSRDWFHKTSTVLRNAYVLCGMCHLQVFKAFDAKIAEHTFVQLDQELGLRHVVAQEFCSADKKIWGAISNLYSQGSWSFEECLHEMTVVRSDISSLLQPRPRIPKQRRRTQRKRGRQRKRWKRKNEILHIRQKEPMHLWIQRQQEGHPMHEV